MKQKSTPRRLRRKRMTITKPKIRAKSARRLLPLAGARRLAPATGEAVIVLQAGAQRRAVIARVQGQGRRIITRIVDGMSGTQHICFAKSKDGSYRLAGSRDPRAMRLFVPN